MKLGIATVVATLALFGGTVANAQLTFTLVAGDFNANNVFVPASTASGIIPFFGTITNPTTGSLTINGGNLSSSLMQDLVNPTTPDSGKFIDNFTDFDFGDLPLTLGAGDVYNLRNFIVLNVPAGTALETDVYTLTFSDVDPAGNPITTVLGSSRFQIGTGDNGVVPEPGAVAILIGGLVGGASFMARRRRK